MGQESLIGRKAEGREDQVVYGVIRHAYRRQGSIGLTLVIEDESGYLAYFPASQVRLLPQEEDENADKDRLDFLEELIKNGNEAHIESGGEGARIFTEPAQRRTEKTVRAALDIAMRYGVVDDWADEEEED